MSPALWQSTLEQEHAAVYGYGLVGGQLGPSANLARTGLELHRSRRDECVAALMVLGVTPAAAAPAYSTPTAVTSDFEAHALAANLERDCMSRYGDLVAQLDGPTRMTGAQWLRISAIQQLRWSTLIPMLPSIE